MVCAYVALFSDRRPEATTTYGDGVTGYIVTPACPAELEPDAGAGGRLWIPRSRSTQPRCSRCSRQRALRARGHRAARRGRHQLPRRHRPGQEREVLRSQGGPRRRRQTAQPDPLTDIADQVGVRVVTYLQRDVDAVARLLAAELDVLDDRDMGVETARQGRFGDAAVTS